MNRRIACLLILAILAGAMGGCATTKDKTLLVYWDEAGGQGFDTYQVHADGSGKSKLVEAGSNVAMAGDWIFYTNYGDGLRLYRQKKDGSEKAALTDGKAVLPAVAGDWIVYQELRTVTNTDPNADEKTSEIMGRLFRMKWDGTENAPITDVDVFEFAVSGNRIAFSGNDWGQNLFVIHVDGTGLQMLDSVRNMNLQISGDWIYYVDASSSGLHRVEWDGTGGMLVTANVSSIGTYRPRYRVADEGVFYANEADGRKLYRCGADGSDSIKLSDDLCSNLFVYDGWVYYSTEGRVTGIFGSHASLGCRIRTDGTRRTEMEEGNRFYIGFYTP